MAILQKRIESTAPVRVCGVRNATLCLCLLSLSLRVAVCGCFCCSNTFRPVGCSCVLKNPKYEGIGNQPTCTYVLLLLLFVNNKYVPSLEAKKPG